MVGGYALGGELHQPGIRALRLVVPPEVACECTEGGTIDIALSAHRSALVVDSAGASFAVVHGVLAGRVRTAPLHGSVRIVADEGGHYRIVVLLCWIQHHAYAVAVAPVVAEDIIGAVADRAEVIIGTGTPEVLLVGGHGVVQGRIAGVFLLIGVGEPAVLPIGRERHLVLGVRIPETVFGEEGGEAVFHAVVHLTPDVLLALVTYLVTAYVSEGRVEFNVGRVGTVLPLETGETLVNYDTGNLAGAVRQTRAVAAVNADGVGVHIH